MKIRSVNHNNRKKAFAVRTAARTYSLPYSQVAPQPAATDPIIRIFVDQELAREAFTYLLKSGKEGTVHIEQVLAYNQDPDHLRDALLYKLTLEAQRRLAASPLSKREITRRLGTSPAQLQRLLDQTNCSKSVDKLLSLLNVLGCDVDLLVRAKRAPEKRAA